MGPEPPIEWGSALVAHPEYVAAAEARVAEWVWARNASWEHLEPFWDERDGRRPHPIRLSEQSGRADLYGFDATGGLVIAREFGDGFGNDDVVKREVLRIDGRQLEYRTLGVRGVYRLIHTEQRVPTYDGDELVAIDRWSYVPHDDTHHYGRETYTWAGGRLVAIGDRLRLTYADDGELLTIVGRDGYPVYRRLHDGEFERALAYLHAELPGRVAAWARRMAPDEPVACVALYYGEYFEHALPPILALATRSEIDALGHEDDAFSPPDYACYDDEPEELEGLDEACQVVNQEWRSIEAETGPSDLLTAVAKAVPGLPYPVYAIGLGDTDLERNVPPALRRAILGH